MSILKFNTATNKFTHGKVDISDCSFTIPEVSLPLTLATAFVDGEYKNTAPYFSTYANGLAWVQSRIAAGKATAGNIIITSNQGACTLASNVNIWLAPSVTVTSFAGYAVNSIYIDGDGTISTLTLDSVSSVQCRAKIITTLNLNHAQNTKIFAKFITETIISDRSIADITLYGSGGTLTIDGESDLDLTGINAEFSGITVTEASRVRGRGFRLLGELLNAVSCYLDFQCCEFHNVTTIPIMSEGPITLSNCWVRALATNGIRMNYGTKTIEQLILNNTIIVAGGAYSVYDGNTTGTPAPVGIYGGSCANKPMYNCTTIGQTLTVDSALKYRAY